MIVRHYHGHLRFKKALLRKTINVFLNLVKGEDLMGRTKLGNANAQRNNNKKKKNDFNTEFASYAQNEALKLSSKNKE